MQERTLYVRVSRQELRRRLAQLPRILSGSAPDQYGIAHGFGLRLAVAFLEKVKLAFEVKADGGTDEAGITWPDLTPETKAYGRRFGRGEQASLKRAAGLGSGNRYAPGGQKGLLNAAQLKRWRQVYAQNLAWLASREGLELAKGHAAAIAWSVVKKEGGKTKLDVYGSRKVQIMRDTGVLFNSLSPGSVSDSGADAQLSARPLGQVLDVQPGSVSVGTNVPYAAALHANKRKPRPLWPAGDRIPSTWWEYFQRQAAGGLIRAVELIAGGRAA